MKSFLVIQTASIGDVILATPLLEYLNEKNPGCSVDLLVKKGNESLFSGHPFLRKVLIWDKKRQKYAGLFRLLAEIRHSQYDEVITCQRFLSTGILTGLSGAKVRTGFSKNPMAFLFNHRVTHHFSPGTHEVMRNLSLLGESLHGLKIRPVLYPTASDDERTASYRQGIYYTISPASLWFTKQFPEERWVELIAQIPAEYTVYLLGSGTDRELCDRILRNSNHKKTINLAGELTFLESASLMKSARMNFTNDSAPMHLASAVNAPVTAVFCSTVPSFGFGPLSDNAAVAEVKSVLPCRPCGIHGHRSCPEGHFGCASGIQMVQLTSRL